jgi:hypothetical protein
MGIEQFPQNPWWFISTYFADARYDTSTDEGKTELRTRIQALKKKLIVAANRAGVELFHASGYGIKGDDAASAHQLHVHMIVSWLPEPTSAPTQGHPYRHICDLLQGEAEKQGLMIWIEKAECPEAVVQYIAKNVKQLSDTVTLPPYFKCISFSQNWPKLNYQLHRKHKLEFWRMKCLAKWLKEANVTLEEFLTLAVLSSFLSTAFDSQSSTSSQDDEHLLTFDLQPQVSCSEDQDTVALDMDAKSVSVKKIKTTNQGEMSPPLENAKECKSMEECITKEFSIRNVVSVERELFLKIGYVLLTIPP